MSRISPERTLFESHKPLSRQNTRMPTDKTRAILKMSSPYTAVLTREQFLFHEVRTTAKLLTEGLSDDEIKKLIREKNLFQYPTEKSLSSMAKTCLQRLKCLENASLVAAIVNQPAPVAKQICLYAMIRQYRLVRDFMITVIGEKYRTSCSTFGKIDLNMFFTRLQEQDAWVASWSDATIAKIKEVLQNLLLTNGYLKNVKSGKLEPVMICDILKTTIRENGDTKALIAFNCFEQ